MGLSMHSFHSLYMCVYMCVYIYIFRSRYAMFLSCNRVLRAMNNLLFDERVEVRENAALLFARVTDTSVGVTQCVDNGAVPLLVKCLEDKDIGVVDR